LEKLKDLVVGGGERASVDEDKVKKFVPTHRNRQTGDAEMSDEESESMDTNDKRQQERKLGIHIKNKLVDRVAGGGGGGSSKRSEPGSFTPDFSSPRMGRRQLVKKGSTRVAGQLGLGRHPSTQTASVAIQYIPGARDLGAVPQTKALARKSSPPPSHDHERSVKRKVDTTSESYLDGADKPRAIISEIHSPLQIKSSRLLLDLASPRQTRNQKENSKAAFLRQLELKPRPSEPVSELHRDQLRALIETALHILPRIKTSALPQVKLLFETAVSQLERHCLDD